MPRNVGGGEEGSASESAANLEEMEEKGRAFDRDRAWADKPLDPEVENERARMLSELDALLALGRDGVVKKLEAELDSDARTSTPVIDSVGTIDAASGATSSPTNAVSESVANLEEMEEKGRAFDRDRAWADKPLDPEVENERARMLSELDALLALGRDGVVKKLEAELG
eukprot:CAMPEP_0185791202 /NCGR_PEP_ID=MMETSP1174-20130828/158244_1 /TAXON_ID=35687 /ORGANISM="Dictyocha speculum, Strain CCMP1381" /LENGTH=169 /DNA_ID=CAMNT_0028486123 /DNA_START=153 /DNA_END=662 /DNA_ORIENTATION=+